MSIYLTCGALLFLPFYLFVDQDDGLVRRLFMQVMLPTTVISFIGFAFMDELFFKLGLYDPDNNNALDETTDDFED